MFRKKWGHKEDDILIKRVSTELRAFVDMDPKLEARVMEEVSKDEATEDVAKKAPAD